MAATGSVDPSKLTPTEKVAKLYCQRVVFQTKVWETLDNFCVNPCDVCWSVIEGVYNATQSSVPCAPEDLLKLIHCKCKGGCVSDISCKKRCLMCAVSCKNCRGNCENSNLT